MFKNKVKQFWSGEKPVLHGLLSDGSPFTAENMAAQGNDAISIDMQQCLLDCSGILPMSQAMRASRVALGAQAPWRGPEMSDEAAGTRGAY